MDKQIPITNIFGNRFLKNRPYERKRPKYLDEYELNEILNEDIVVDSIQAESTFENEPILHFDSDSKSDLQSDSESEYESNSEGVLQVMEYFEIF